MVKLLKKLQSKLVSLLPLILQNLIFKYKKFIIYTAIGGTAVILDFTIFTVLAQVYDVTPLLANSVSTFTAMIYSFLINSFVNFKVSDKLLLRFISFGIVALFGFAISSLMLAIFSYWLGLNPVLIKATSLPIVLVVQFMLNSKVTFKVTGGE